MSQKIETYQSVNSHFTALYESFVENKDAPFVIDGQNYVFNLQRKYQKVGLINLIDLISLLNHPIFLILPDFLIKRYNVNKAYLDNKSCSLIRIDNHKLDDWGILDLADKFQGIILSNDHFREFRPYYNKKLFSRLIQFIAFTIHGNILIKIPFIEFINLQIQNQNDLSSENHENTTSPGFEAISS